MGLGEAAEGIKGERGMGDELGVLGWSSVTLLLAWGLRIRERS